MKTAKFIFISITLGLFAGLPLAKAQSDTAEWDLARCINYAWQNNIQVQKSELQTQSSEVNYEQAKANRFPSVNASVSQNFAWSRPLGQNNAYGDYSGSNSTNYSVSSSVPLFNGGKLNNTVKQSSLSNQISQFNTDITKENIGLSVADAYLQVIYAEEQVKNSEKQVESTDEQLRLAGERVKLGAISQADYLQVKSQLASEKLTLANANKALAVNRVTLMQLLEIPVNDSFRIVHPDLSNFTIENRRPVADSIYQIALGIKPEIKSAELSNESAELDVNIAKADYLPRLTLNGGVSTAYASSLSSLAYDYQVKNELRPSLGLSLSIPIYQNNDVRNRVSLAKIGSQNAKLSEIDTRNQLRKEIEQACVNVNSAEKQYQASLEEYDATKESYDVSAEKFENGLISSIDFLIQKNNLIIAESSLLQSKYNLIYSYKTLDFYSGVPLTL